MKDLLRKIPKVDDILRAEGWSDLRSVYPEEIAKAGLRHVLDELRAAIREGKVTSIPPVEALLVETRKRAVKLIAPGLKKVINGTGVIIHTNLGRSPLAKAAIDRLISVAAGYSNLEYDLTVGKRGDRYEHCLSLMRRLTGAEGALIVNNNAAAVLLILNTFADGKEVIIARGELVEIGGSFRIPEIMAKSGAVLREVGTTNRTFIEDYGQALSERTGLIMKVHTSNYRIKGFVHETESAELAALASSHNIPFYYDIGSGLLSHPGAANHFGEPSLKEEAAKGINIVSGSGDKLLGGPQAGIIVGKGNAIAAMKKNPLTRTYRPDKFTLAALEATLLLYLDTDRAKREIPVLRMLNENEAMVRTRSLKIARLLRKRLGTAGTATVKVVPLQSEVGGGSMPDVLIPSCGLSVQPSSVSVEHFEQGLRDQEIPVIGRIEKGLFLVDMRTIEAEDEKQLISAIEAALQDGR